MISLMLHWIGNNNKCYFLSETRKTNGGRKDENTFTGTGYDIDSFGKWSCEEAGNICEFCFVFSSSWSCLDTSNSKASIKWHSMGASLLAKIPSLGFLHLL